MIAVRQKPCEKNIRQEFITAHDMMRPGGFGLTRRAISFCPFSPGDRIADIGCGSGSSVDLLKEEFGLKALGVDLKAESGISISNTSSFIRGNAERLPFKPESLDGVMAECSLSVLKNKDDALSEFARVLRSGGFLMVTDVYGRAPEAIIMIDELPFCMSGIMTKQGLTQALCTCGLITKVFEDHSQLLNEFVARMIMEHGSLKSFCNCGTSTSADLAKKMMLFRQARPGYFMLIAQKI
ncbi:MAG TPA: methyltransferase domain-containing protein [Dissulfurispiraceae bacterium]|nr:methyltransferase domain-containing protein [Dissulfurispiraceae bacterium]